MVFSELLRLCFSYKACCFFLSFLRFIYLFERESVHVPMTRGVGEVCGVWTEGRESPADSPLSLDPTAGRSGSEITT